jgi:hypothetical protein
MSSIQQDHNQQEKKQQLASWLSRYKSKDGCSPVSFRPISQEDASGASNINVTLTFTQHEALDQASIEMGVRRSGHLEDSYIDVPAEHLAAGEHHKVTCAE